MDIEEETKNEQEESKLEEERRMTDADLKNELVLLKKKGWRNWEATCCISCPYPVSLDKGQELENENVWWTGLYSVHYKINYIDTLNP